MKSWVRLQEATPDTIYCVVDLHSLSMLSSTRTQSPHGVMMPRLADETRTMAATLLACGIDPTRSILYAQSHVAEHTQLYWLLGCMASKGRLEVAPQYKVDEDRFLCSCRAPHVLSRFRTKVVASSRRSACSRIQCSWLPTFFSSSLFLKR